MRSSIVLLCVFSVAASGVVPATARATEVRGRVVVSGTLPPAPPPARRAYYWSLDNGVLPPREDRILPDRDLAIVLTHRGRPPARNSGAAPVIVHVAQGGLDPRAVVVRPGTLLRFQNDDPFAHELYSPTHTDFGPEPMVAGQTRPFVAPASGQVEIRCKRAPHFRGFLVVVDAWYVVTPGADGAFTLTAEPGTYTVRTFFEGRWLAETELLVNSERSQTVEIPVDASRARSAAPPAAAAPAPGAGSGGRPAPAQVAPPGAVPATPR